MSGTEALARVLGATECGDWDCLHSEGECIAQGLLADPGPLLAALHQAGVLHRQTRRLERGGPREGRYATVEPDGRIEGGDGLATGWEDTDA